MVIRTRVSPDLPSGEEAISTVCIDRESEHESESGIILVTRVFSHTSRFVRFMKGSK